MVGGLSSDQVSVMSRPGQPPCCNYTAAGAGKRGGGEGEHRQIGAGSATHDHPLPSSRLTNWLDLRIRNLNFAKPAERGDIFEPILIILIINISAAMKAAKEMLLWGH